MHKNHGGGKLHNWSEQGVCHDCGCHTSNRTDPCPNAWRYRHVAYVDWSYASTRHPREDIEQEALYTGAIRDYLQVPEGWKLVPIEPTVDMECAPGHEDCPTPDAAKAAYRAMLDAAPSPPPPRSHNPEGDEQ